MIEKYKPIAEVDYENLCEKLKGGETYTNDKGKDLPNPMTIFDKEELAALNDWHNYLNIFEADNVGNQRKLNLFNALIRAKKLLIPYKIRLIDIDESNIKEVLKSIIESKYEHSTRHLSRMALRMFIRWQHYGDDTKDKLKLDGDPRVVRMIPSSISKRYKKKLSEKDLLTRDEFIQLARDCNSVRYRALICVLFETGARIDEILRLTMKDIVFDSQNNTYTLTLNSGTGVYYGKTGMRRNTIQIYFKELNDWLNEHPFRGDKDIADRSLFYNWKHGRKSLGYVPMSQVNFHRWIIRKCKNLGINKRITAHTFRHTFVTHKASEGWSKEEIAIWVGWTKTSKQFELYDWNTSQNVIDKKNRLMKGEAAFLEADYLKCISTSCGAINSKLQDNCYMCRSPLTSETMIRTTSHSQNLQDAVMLLKEALGKDTSLVHKLWKNGNGNGQGI